MKHSNSSRATTVGRLAKYMLIGSAAAAFLGLSMNAQAQLPTCTVDNWTDAIGLTDADTGYQGSDNRRYGGPCGLRVPFNGDERFVMFESGQGETSYIARFYAFLNNAGSDAMIIFAGEGGGEDQVQIWYNFPAANDLTLRAFDQGGASHDLTFEGVGNGWHSIEFEWHQGASANIAFIVNSDDPNDEESMTIDTSGLSIQSAHLGDVAGMADAGYADFDDFDSRRSTRPGRLLVGDADDNGSIGTGDLVSILSEINGNAFAPGQPDCDENGSVGTGDLVCVLTIINQ
jgi:hypothetical protein